MNRFLGPLIEQLRGLHAGAVGAGVFGGIALLWVIFGFWRMVFILGMTALGYAVGVTFFRDREQFRKWLDRLFPPGNFR